MNTIERTYNELQIELLKKAVVQGNLNGNKTAYRILIDQMDIVPRTTEVSFFDSYKKFIRDDTEELTIVVFKGQSYHATRYVFKLKPESKIQQPPLENLSGIIEAKIEEARRQWQEEEKAKEQENEMFELKKQNQQLKEAIYELKQNRSTGGDDLGNILGLLFQNMGSTNTNTFAQNPSPQQKPFEAFGDFNSDDEQQLIKITSFFGNRKEALHSLYHTLYSS